MQLWRTYSEKFLAISQREQILILVSGLVVIIFGFFNLSIDGNLVAIAQDKKQVRQLSSANRSMENSIQTLQQSLMQDPNAALNRQIEQYEHKLAKVDQALLTLTSDLIDPIQMRHALVELLKVQKGVSLASFQLIGATPMAMGSSRTADEKSGQAQEKAPDKAEDAKAEVESLVLYRHGIKIKLQGSYFQLRDYLTQLESLQWKFFWQEFHYQLKEYPISELDIEIYSLSTRQEFIGG